MEGLVWRSAVIADEATSSAAVDLGQPYKSLVAYFPTLDSTTIGISTAMTSDGTYQLLSVISTNDGDDDQILASTNTGAFNITIPFFGWQHLKFVVASQTSGPFTIYCAGFD